MDIEKITDLQASLPTWDFLLQLPRELQGFTFQPGGELNGHVLTLCSYLKAEQHRRLDLIYTKETYDFMPIKEIGLHKFRDIRYFTRSKAEFSRTMPQVLPRLLEEMAPDYEAKCQSVLRSKGITTWDYISKLPPKIGSFELFISPDHPLEYINNSLIFVDYSDFATGDQLVFLYNKVVNQFFAETKKHYIPGTIHDFDCHSLQELSKILDQKLQPYLEKLAAAPGV